MERLESRDNKQVLKIYTIVEKPGSQKDIWLDIGVASYNRDGSISAKLDALPVNGLLHIREFEPRRFTETVRQEGDRKPPYEWQQGVSK